MNRVSNVLLINQHFLRQRLPNLSELLVNQVKNVTICKSVRFCSNAVEPQTNPRKKSKIPLINWISDDFLRGHIKINAFFFYADMIKQINYLDIFKTMNLNDTFNSWFLITELHIWMIMVRLKNEGKDGKIFTKYLVSALWDDCAVRAKVLSPGDSSVSKKQLQILAQEFRASLLIYDDGLLNSDTVLASALWYRFFEKSCEDPRKLELLTAYVRSQVYNLEKTSKDDILLKAKVKLKPFPVDLIRTIK